MIYFTLSGGLCNMLFQIAAVKSIGIDNNVDVICTNIKEQLSYLNLEKNFNPNLNHSNEYEKLGMFSDLKNGELPKDVKVIYYPFHFEKKQLDIKNDLLLSGFFQTEKYFENNEEYIKEVFKPTDEIISLIKEKYGKFLNKSVTSIHVRRGDYLRYPQHHPTQTLEYYKNGVSLTNTECYLVFSDDINWCKQNFIGEEYNFVENEKDYIELYLMSMCTNNIISNSSFSWWGAWLNDNKNKIVVGPNNWFGSAISHNTDDILPKNWVKI